MPDNYLDYLEQVAMPKDAEEDTDEPEDTGAIFR